MQTSGDLKTGDSLFRSGSLWHEFTQLTKLWHGNGLGHYKNYEVLREVHTIKIRFHHFNDEIVFVSE